MTDQAEREAAVVRERIRLREAVWPLGSIDRRRALETMATYEAAARAAGRAELEGALRELIAQMEGAGATRPMPSVSSEDLRALLSEGANTPLAGALPVELRGDGPCVDCGTFDNFIWSTENVLWNRVTGENVIHEEAVGAILCVTCFVKRAHEAGLRPTGWRLMAEWPWREARTLLPIPAEGPEAREGDE